MENPTYLGDSVYAYYSETGQIELRLGDHRNPTLIYLEPSVLERLNMFYKAMTQPVVVVFDPTPQPQFRTFEYRKMMQEAADRGELIQRRFNGDKGWSEPYKPQLAPGEALRWEVFQYRLGIFRPGETGTGE